MPARHENDSSVGSHAIERIGDHAEFLTCGCVIFPA